MSSIAVWCIENGSDSTECILELLEVWFVLAARIGIRPGNVSPSSRAHEVASVLAMVYIGMTNAEIATRMRQ